MLGTIIINGYISIAKEGAMLYMKKGFCFCSANRHRR